MLGALSYTHAQSIVGKWKCSKEFLELLGLNSNNIRGRYRFRKDSTFTVSINAGSMRWPSGNPNRSVYVVAKGRYSIANNKITTFVKPDDIDCNVDFNVEDPDFPPSGMWRRVSAATYDSNMAEASFQEATLRREKYFLWKWLNAPFMLKKDSLVIGGLIELRR